MLSPQPQSPKTAQSPKSSQSARDIDPMMVPFELTTEQIYAINRYFENSRPAIEEYYKNYHKYCVKYPSVVPITSHPEAMASFLERGIAGTKSLPVDLWIAGIPDITVLPNDSTRVTPNPRAELKVLEDVVALLSKPEFNAIPVVYVHVMDKTRLTPMPNPKMFAKIGSKYRILQGAGFIPANAFKVCSTYKITPKPQDDDVPTDDASDRRSLSCVPCKRSISESAYQPKLSDLAVIEKYVMGDAGTYITNFMPLPSNTTLRSVGVTSRFVPDGLLDAPLFTAEQLAHIAKVAADRLNPLFAEREPLATKVNEFAAALAPMLPPHDKEALESWLKTKLGDFAAAKVPLNDLDIQILARIRLQAYLNIASVADMNFSLMNPMYKKVGRHALLRGLFFKPYDNRPYEGEAARDITVGLVSSLMAAGVAIRYYGDGTPNPLQVELDIAKEHGIRIMEAAMHEPNKEYGFGGCVVDNSWGGVHGGVDCFSQPDALLSCEGTQCLNAFGEGVRIILDAMDGDAISAHEPIVEKLGNFEKVNAMQWAAALLDYVFDTIGNYKLPEAPGLA
jgi:hypothetical protein